MMADRSTIDRDIAEESTDPLKMLWLDQANNRKPGALAMGVGPEGKAKQSKMKQGLIALSCIF